MQSSSQSPRSITLHNLVLIGFMGTGKSTISHMLQRELHYPVIDTDKLIEEQQQMTINDIFAQHGESHFRQLEHQLLADLVQSQPQHHIIATGGGLPIREDNQALLQQLGYLVWLDSPVDELYERISKHGHRPLLNQPNPEQAFTQLYQQRAPVYRSIADLHLNTHDLTFSEITYGIIESARFHFAP